jgi:hypothetical protein
MNWPWMTRPSRNSKMSPDAIAASPQPRIADPARTKAKRLNFRAAILCSLACIFMDASAFLLQAKGEQPSRGRVGRR